MTARLAGKEPVCFHGGQRWQRLPPARLACRAALPPDEWQLRPEPGLALAVDTQRNGLVPCPWGSPRPLAGPPQHDRRVGGPSCHGEGPCCTSALAERLPARPPISSCRPCGRHPRRPSTSQRREGLSLHARHGSDRAWALPNLPLAPALGKGPATPAQLAAKDVVRSCGNSWCHTRGTRPRK